MFTAHRLFPLPYALSMGPQRAGTSWLDRYLRVRRDVCLPHEVKEIFFFDRHHSRGADFYARHFKPEPHHRLVMEISTTAFDHFDAPERVAALFGTSVRLLCPLRHPVVRSYSLYLHYLRYGIVSGSLSEACAQNPQILESSRYCGHLENWLRHFPREALNIVYQEDLESNQEVFLKNVCNALGLPFMPAPQEINERFNATTYSRSGLLARYAQRGADWLRRHQLYSLVNIAKKAGLKRVIFGKENPDAKATIINPLDRAYLEEKLDGEIARLESLIGPIPAWHMTF
ncbi:MAG: sulfotransferase domain-containing protein [Alphaproteobacteria bacterium]|nr:sulfotransferase domain-containing protein [Alphaproteobacteria bacterium]